MTCSEIRMNRLKSLQKLCLQDGARVSQSSVSNPRPAGDSNKKQRSNSTELDSYFRELAPKIFAQCHQTPLESLRSNNGYTADESCISAELIVERFYAMKALRSTQHSDFGGAERGFTSLFELYQDRGETIQAWEDAACGNLIDKYYSEDFIQNYLRAISVQIDGRETYKAYGQNDISPKPRAANCVSPSGIARAEDEVFKHRIFQLVRELDRELTLLRLSERRGDFETEARRAKKDRDKKLTRLDLYEQVGMRLGRVY